MSDQTFKTLHEFVKAAHLRLNQINWDYLIGGTETETTLRRNRHAIDTKALLPRVLCDVTTVDPSTEILGQSLSLPVVLAPIGSLQVFDPKGGAGAAVAADQAGIMSIASSVCSPSLEEIAAASAAPKIYQLYVRGDAVWVDDIVDRIIESGYLALCLTVDTAVLSRRERDIAKRVVPTSQASPGDFKFQAQLNWDEIARLKQKYDLPIILKGINHPADAQKALDLGIEVIYLSNHGGRQLDQGLGSLDLLAEIKAVIGNQAELMIDGGFYRGTDIIKAIALGADAVGLGRLQGWALAAGGPEALAQCLKILRHEICETMALCGVTTLKDLDPSFVRAAPAVAPPSVFSAFPLLDLADQGY